MKNVIPLVILIAISIFLWFLIYRNSKSRNTKLKEYFAHLTEKYGLKLDETNKIGKVTYPLVTGIYKRRQVGIGCYTGNPDKVPQTYIRVECSNSHSLGFHLKKRSSKTGITETSGAIKMMDTDFDEKYIVTSNSPNLIFPVFSFNVKYSLLQAIHLGLKGELKLENNLLDYTEPGFIKDENSNTRIELVMHIMCDIADELEKN